MEVIGQEKQSRRPLERLRLLLLRRGELVDRVERQFLDAGPRVELVMRDQAVNLFIDAVRAVVAVAVSLRGEVPLRVEERVVDAPCIDCHARRDLSELGALLHAVQDLPEQALRVPAAVAVLLHHTVLKTVDLLQDHPAVFHMSEHMAAAGRAEVDRQIVFWHVSPSFLPLLLSAVRSPQSLRPGYSHSIQHNQSCFCVVCVLFLPQNHILCCIYVVLCGIICCFLWFLSLLYHTQTKYPTFFS